MARTESASEAALHVERNDVVLETALRCLHQWTYLQALGTMLALEPMTASGAFETLAYQQDARTIVLNIIRRGAARYGYEPADLCRHAGQETSRLPDRPM